MGMDNYYQKDVYENFSIQCLSYHNSNEPEITNSIIVNPKKQDLRTIQIDSHIGLWRCSDFFEDNDGNTIVNYKISIILA